MPKYDFKCQECGISTEISASFNDDLVAPMCCSSPMKRDYTNDNAGFIPTSGMYSKDNR